MILPCGVQTSNKVIAHDPIRGRLRQVPAGAGTAGGEQSPVSVHASIHSSHSTHEFRLFRLFRGSMNPPCDENSRTQTTPNFQLISPGFTCFQLVSPNFTSRPQGGHGPKQHFPPKSSKFPRKRFRLRPHWRKFADQNHPNTPPLQHSIPLRPNQGQ